MKTRRYITILFALACAFAAAAICFTFAHGLGQKLPLENEYHLLRDEGPWAVLSGCSEAEVMPGRSVQITGDTLTITSTVFPEELGENILLFRNNRQCVTVRAEGETLLLVGSGERRFRFSTTGYFAAPLPTLGRPYELEISFTNLTGGECLVPEFCFSTLNDIIILLCMKDLTTIAIIPVWIMLSFLLTVMSIYARKRKQPDYRIFSLYTFLIIAVLWSLTDMYIMPVILPWVELNTTINHYLLMLLPIPVLYFVSWLCTYRPPRLRIPVLSLLLGNIVVQSVLFLLNVFSLHQMAFVSQGLLMLMIIYGNAATMLEYRTHPTAIGRAQVLTFLGVGIMSSLAVAAYWLQPEGSNLYQVLFHMTILVFLIFMAGLVLFVLEQRAQQAQIADAVRETELNTYRAISNLDPLTGLQNRRAFDAQMQKIEEDPNAVSAATLVFMDLNGLKHANDRYGHMAGDELIIAAGRCIRQSFEPEGRTFRVGGDEFAAIVPGIDDIRTCLQRLDRAVEEYNLSATVPLSIARGTAGLGSPGEQRLSVMDWKIRADKKMYENKADNRRIPGGDTTEDYLELISGFVRALDARDPVIAEHTRRVGALSDGICGLLGLSDVSRQQVHIAACLHDIGKIGIPDAVLRKPRQFTPEERLTMQRHPVIGEEILRHNRSFGEVSQIVRHHHERYDGRGYPDGLSGADIPLGSRIIAIADSIDAMTSTRSYRLPRSLPECREEIQRNLGIMYDPAIGEIVLEHWEEIESILRACRIQPENP